MDLSIIIVNYNVKYFLEQCLCSVLKAIEGIQTEIFVVDNASKDGSVEYLKPLYPRVKFIASKTNDGFAKANNKALAMSQGDYVLFINPDTIVSETCFTKSIEFFKTHDDCGALGFQMIDGAGNFSPESKRSFPSLSAAFYKLFGLSLIFPNSATYNKYAVGNLDKDANHSIEVLSGACMMMSRKVINLIGGFNESYFMYGEDIEFSYQVIKNGYKNYYLGEQKIIHFKGESTKRGSLNYIKHFYNAMSIFVKKHYSGNKAFVFNLSINIAIWLRAFLSVLQTIITQSGMLFFDAGVVAASLFVTKHYWQIYFNNNVAFVSPLANYFIPIFTIVFVVGALLSGIYDNLYKPLKAMAASISAIVIMLAVYSLMPEEYRFSRGVILLGGFVSGLMVTLIRWIFIKLGLLKDFENEKQKKLVIIGSNSEQNAALNLLQKTDIDNRFLGRISPKTNEENTIGNLTEIESLHQQVGFGEIILCEGSLGYNQIFEITEKLKNKGISFKFFGKKTNSIIGSDSKTETGETITTEGVYKIAVPYQKRMKRLIDTWVSFIMIITFPIQFLLINNAKVALKNAFMVMLRKKTWVGYATISNQLPTLEPSILTPSGYPNNGRFDVINSVLKKADTLYAKEYDWLLDLKIIFNNYRQLGS